MPITAIPGSNSGVGVSNLALSKNWQTLWTQLFSYMVIDWKTLNSNFVLLMGPKWPIPLQIEFCRHCPFDRIITKLISTIKASDHTLIKVNIKNSRWIWLNLPMQNKWIRDAYWPSSCKKSLIAWVSVIPKEVWVRVAPPILLLVWHRLFQKIKKIEKKIQQKLKSRCHTNFWNFFFCFIWFFF